MAKTRKRASKFPLLVSKLRIPKRKIHVSQSAVSSFSSCRQKWLYGINDLVTPGKAMGTIFGSACHYILGEARIDPKLMIEDITESFIANFDFDGYNAELRQKAEIQIAMAERVCKIYRLHFIDDFKNKRFLMTEETLKDEITLDNPYNDFFDINRKVIYDGVYQDKAGKCYAYELKTKSRIDEDGISSQLAFDFQNLYTLSMMREAGLYKKFKLAGTLFEIIRKPQLRIKVKEPLLDFLNRIEKDVVSRPEFYFFRAPISYTKRDIDNFEKNEMSTVLWDMYEYIEGYRKACKNSFACLFPFKCQYVDNCATGKTHDLIQQKRNR